MMHAVAAVYDRRRCGNLLYVGAHRAPLQPIGETPNE